MWKDHTCTFISEEDVLHVSVESCYVLLSLVGAACLKKSYLKNSDYIRLYIDYLLLGIKDLLLIHNFSRMNLCHSVNRMVNEWSGKVTEWCSDAIQSPFSPISVKWMAEI